MEENKKPTNIEELVQQWSENQDKKVELTVTAKLEFKMPECCDKLEEFMSGYDILMRRLYLDYGSVCFKNMRLASEVHLCSDKSSTHEQ